MTEIEFKELRQDLAILKASVKETNIQLDGIGFQNDTILRQIKLKDAELEFYTVQQFAKKFYKCERTVLNLIHKKEIEAKKIGGQWYIPVSQFIM